MVHVNGGVGVGRLRMGKLMCEEMVYCGGALGWRCSFAGAGGPCLYGAPLPCVRFPASRRMLICFPIYVFAFLASGACLFAPLKCACLPFVRRILVCFLHDHSGTCFFAFASPVSLILVDRHGHQAGCKKAFASGPRQVGLGYPCRNDLGLLCEFMISGFYGDVLRFYDLPGSRRLSGSL
jgi:hypothetical protein